MAWLHKLTNENVNSLYNGEDYEEPFTGYYQSETENLVLYNKRIVIKYVADTNGYGFVFYDRNRKEYEDPMEIFYDVFPQGIDSKCVVSICNTPVTEGLYFFYADDNDNVHVEPLNYFSGDNYYNRVGGKWFLEGDNLYIEIPIPNYGKVTPSITNKSDNSNFNPKDFMIIYVKDGILYGASRRGESLLGIVDHLPFTPGGLE